jgi:hypothetical protein
LVFFVFGMERPHSNFKHYFYHECQPAASSAIHRRAAFP